MNNRYNELSPSDKVMFDTLINGVAIGRYKSSFISAAPDLYTALEGMVEEDECNRPDGRPLLDCDAAYAALKKARGK